MQCEILLATRLKKKANLPSATKPKLCTRNRADGNRFDYLKLIANMFSHKDTGTLLKYITCRYIYIYTYTI